MGVGCQTEIPQGRLTLALRRKPFSYDLTHHFCRKRLVRQAEIDVERIVDQGLASLSGSFGFGFETFQYGIVKIDGDAGLSDLGNHRPAFALGEVILLLHKSFFLYAYIATSFITAP